MKLTFWGSGTSTGVPVVGCSCAVCRSPDPRNRRRRASVLVEADGRNLLIDAGVDFRSQALDAGLETLDGVLLTHGHADHILGLDDLRPLSWKRPIPVWADDSTLEVVRRAFPYFFGPGDDKTSRPKLVFHRLEPGTPVTAAGFDVLPLAIGHGDGEILGFRLGNLAYLTDCNGLPPATIPLLAGLDVLILGALRPTFHPTHFSLPEAIEAAGSVGARRTYFTHFSHDVDHGTWEQNLPQGMALAHDGLVVEW